MANEIQAPFASGKTVYALIRNSTGQIWSTTASAFQSYLTANYANFVVSLTEQSTSGYYAGTMPAAIPAGVYAIVAKQQLGGSPAESDPVVASGDLQWNGSGTASLGDVATSGLIGQFLPTRPTRGVMIPHWPVWFVSSADHLTSFTSGIVSGQISRDGGAFTALQSGAFTEVGQGLYDLQALTSGDLLANTVSLYFTAVGISGGAADPQRLSFQLQRTSGQ